MGLTTFGAVMGFASELIRQAEDTYGILIQKMKDPVLRGILEGLLGEERKNRSLMEKTRRENVTEMILEPIAGLEEETYRVNVRETELMEDTALLKAALLLEDRERRFFQDAAAKVSLPEGARIFRKLARKKEENLTKLQGFGLNQSLENR